MSTDLTAIDRLVRELRSGLVLLRCTGEGYRERVLVTLQELGSRPAAELAVYAHTLLHLLHGLHDDRGDAEVSAGLARALRGAGDDALAAAASESLASLGSPESALARMYAVKLAELAAAYPALRAVAVGGASAVRGDEVVPTKQPPAPLLGPAYEFGSYVEAAIDLLAQDAGMERSAYRAAVRARVEDHLGHQASAGRMRIVPCMERGAVVLRCVMAVRERQAADPAREVSLAELRARGLDAPIGANVSLRVWVRSGTDGPRMLCEALDSAVARLARHATSLAMGEPGPTPIGRLGAAHAPPGLVLASFCVMSVLHVVEFERDPSREITRERLASELQFDDDLELGDELCVFHPDHSAALLEAAVQAFWAEEAIVHLDGWREPRTLARLDD